MSWPRVPATLRLSSPKAQWAEMGAENSCSNPGVWGGWDKGIAEGC